MMPKSLKVLIMNKIKFVDKESNSKVLLSVYWSQLKGNKQPYLSVTIHQVKLNGSLVYNWKDQLAAIKQINLELFNIVNLHLSNKDGSRGVLENANYYYSLTRNQLTNPIKYTSEQKASDLKACRDALHNGEILNKVERLCGYDAVKYLKEYLIESGDLFKYKDLNKARVHWVNQYENQNGLLFRGKTLKDKVESVFSLFFETLDKYRKLKNDYKSHPSVNDIWTAERLTEFLGCTLAEVYKMLVTGDTSTLNAIVNERIQSDIIFIDEMTDKYNIKIIVN
jgi:hypothetical protein